MIIEVDDAGKESGREGGGGQWTREIQSNFRYANASGEQEYKLARKRFRIWTRRILTGDGQVLAFHKQDVGIWYETGDSTPGTTPNLSNSTLKC